jgi:N-acetylglutamate synthase-like GNAT family acetyltransferase
MNCAIRKCTKDDLQVLEEIIRRSFQDVAQRFSLTQENAPRHPSNCTMEWIQKDMERGVTYFTLENDSRVAGCVALELASSETCYLERLAVLLDQRQQGFGKALVAHALLSAKRLGVHCVNIGIIMEHIELKNWYKRIGFVEEVDCTPVVRQIGLEQSARVYGF